MNGLGKLPMGDSIECPRHATYRTLQPRHPMKYAHAEPVLRPEWSNGEYPSEKRNAKLGHSVGMVCQPDQRHYVS